MVVGGLAVAWRSGGSPEEGEGWEGHDTEEPNCRFGFGSAVCRHVRRRHRSGGDGAGHELDKRARRGREWVVLGHGLKACLARLGQVDALVAATSARGCAGPAGRPPRLGWARRTALCEGEVPTVFPWSTAKTSMHPYAAGSQVCHVASAARTRLRAHWARRQRRCPCLHSMCTPLNSPNSKK
jgi:hypothetical protein